ncbi:sporulation transcription factor Spo0A [compost metagenome]|jgi:DNA-binding NarL/FixJ family response regulator
MSTLKTFIVEDNPLICENLVSTLEELTRVEVVGSAVDEASAVQWLSTEGNRADLIIIDIFLRNGSGLGVLQVVKDADLPLRRVVLTNYASTDIRRRCTALGADRVFDKSCELDELITYCARVADGTATAPGAPG